MAQNLSTLQVRLIVGLTVGAATICPPAALGWTSVGPGIDYQEFYLSTPNRVYVARMDRLNTECFVDSTLAGSRLSVNETIGSQAARYHDAINYVDQDWGQRNNVIVAINGDFPDTSDNTPVNGQIMSGWYVKQMTSAHRFYYTLDQTLGIGGLAVMQQKILFPDSGDALTIQGINRVRSADDLVVYTPQYDSTTKTDNSGVEVLVEMTRPAMALPASDPPLGIIRQVRQNAGSTPIGFDQVVISATGSRAADLLSRAQVGATVGISFVFAGSPVNADRTYATIGGGENFLANGLVMGGQEIRHPRTAIAYNNRYLYFVVVDGRSSSSVGMTMTELGYFCRDYLDATWGINQDGGGSSTMIVNGELKNSPSDGRQRAVINGIFMGIRQPKQHSTTFSSGDEVRTSSPNVSVRLGPGTNYLVRTTVGNNVQGVVLDHHLRGIHAKGDYWWKCDFNGTHGWVSESLLALVSAGDLPGFTQHPEPAYACAGDSAAFSVAASGAGTLSYRWQFNGVDLQEGGAYAGTSTPVLTIAHPTVAEVGSYRCVVTGANGSVVSWSAPLRMMTATGILVQPQSTEPPLPRGADVEFSTLARGEGTLTYRWQKDGQDISDSVKYTGTTTPALTVWGALTEDEGEYRCVVTGACGPVATDPAVLTVLSPDFDRDGDVDQADFGFLQACFSGPTNPQLDPACRGANLDADTNQDVDQSDLAVFLECWSGPDQPRPPGC